MPEFWRFVCNHNITVENPTGFPWDGKTRPVAGAGREWYWFKTLETPPSKYISTYWLKAALASISNLRNLSEGVTPSSNGGSYRLDHGER
uniref:Uncharacterized protein n=1 Tax=Romanomermis culicivorax TaxID=13658 RepID=A0A915JB56_ROMCU